MKKLLLALVIATLRYVSYSRCRANGGTENQCLVLTITPVLVGLAAGAASGTAAGAYRR